MQGCLRAGNPQSQCPNHPGGKPKSSWGKPRKAGATLRDSFRLSKSAQSPSTRGSFQCHTPPSAPDDATVQRLVLAVAFLGISVRLEAALIFSSFLPRRCKKAPRGRAGLGNNWAYKISNEEEKKISRNNRGFLACPSVSGSVCMCAANRRRSDLASRVRRCDGMCSRQRMGMAHGGSGCRYSAGRSSYRGRKTLLQASLGSWRAFGTLQRVLFQPMES